MTLVFCEVNRFAIEIDGNRGGAVGCTGTVKLSCARGGLCSIHVYLFWASCSKVSGIWGTQSGGFTSHPCITSRFCVAFHGIKELSVNSDVLFDQEGSRLSLQHGGCDSGCWAEGRSNFDKGDSF